MGRRVLRDEGGFTLPEMLVTTMMMLVVMFALYSIFDMSIKVFSFGNDKVEAVENTRIGLEKMTRELRAAYPADNVDTDPLETVDNRKKNLFWTAGAPGTAVMPTQDGSQITFGNDRNGNRRIYDPATGALDSGEQITYSLDAVNNRLLRNGEPVAENVKDVDEDGKALTFRYLDANGNTVTDETSIRTVRIRLEVSFKRGISQQPGTQILQTDVTLRNRSG
jgi:prepilin-type N-terminal cleavage/methylation domain-containing protein